MDQFYSPLRFFDFFFSLSLLLPPLSSLYLIPIYDFIPLSFFALSSFFLSCLSLFFFLFFSFLFSPLTFKHRENIAKVHGEMTHLKNKPPAVEYIFVEPFGFPLSFFSLSLSFSLSFLSLFSLLFSFSSSLFLFIQDFCSAYGVVSTNPYGHAGNNLLSIILSFIFII